MNILIMGAAGSGKGTMAQLIIQKYSIPHISTGNMFRSHMYANTPLGLEARKYIDEGRLVPDEVTIQMIQERLLEPDCLKGYLLDGYPRTLPQAVAFEDIAHQISRPVQAVINLKVQLDDLAERVTGRRVCEKCGAIYHIKQQPPKVEGVCDLCGGKLIHRSDDTVHQLGVRLNEHVTLTQPVLDFYAKKGLVFDIDASRSIDEVFKDIDSVLEKI
ncbi:MAG TPA: adenylate kinase [Erysipelotrichaceae bacterium]|nr:adenylate kinase [Erysipelotrichaceae bacterium]